MIDITKPFIKPCLDELLNTLDFLYEDLSEEDDEFMIYELEEDITNIKTLIEMHYLEDK